MHTALFTSRELGFTGRSVHGEYADNVEEMDWSVGQTRKALQSRGLDHNTIVVFSSDNGPFLERFEDGGSSGFVLDAAGQRVPLRGGKGQIWEGGIRVPTYIVWPGVVTPRSEVSAVTSHLDFFPTLLGAAGIRAKFSDGMDLRSLFVAKETVKSVRDRVLLHNCGLQVAAGRYGRWKLVVKVPIWENATLQACPRVQVCDCGVAPPKPLLFDMVEDPGESRPVRWESRGVTEESKAARRILNAMREFTQETKGVKSVTESPPLPWKYPCGNDGSCQCIEGRPCTLQKGRWHLPPPSLSLFTD